MLHETFPGPGFPIAQEVAGLFPPHFPELGDKCFCLVSLSIIKNEKRCIFLGLPGFISHASDFLLNTLECHVAVCIVHRALERC